jgi:hypothetical protein
MNIFRMVDMHAEETGSGILVDMIYEIVDGIESVIEIKIYEIINSIVTGIVPQVSPIVKLAFASNMLKLLEIERNEK